ncbi:MAG: hypothetical protein HY403_05155 [Elusimicrobia bacterium]|nr:hypothetical protein [Elusimicrobiota bacterium]
MTPRRFLLALAASLVLFAPPARAEGESIGAAEARPAPKPARKKAKKAPAKRKPYDYDRSKYKSREPSQTSAYKFDEKGEPIRADEKKAPATKKKRSEPPKTGLTEGLGACGPQESCAEKKAESDAL